MSEISINDLQCSRIKDLSLAQQQLFFDDFKSPRNKGFQDTLSSYTDKPTAMYYIIYYKNTPLMYFSLSAGAFFGKEFIPTPDDIAIAVYCRNDLMYFYKTQERSYLRSLITTLRNKGYVFSNNDEFFDTLDRINATLGYIQDRDDPDYDVHSYLDYQSAIELVEFCGNKSDAAKKVIQQLGLPEKYWGVTLFWVFIVPVVEYIAKFIGSTSLMLYAANDLDSEQLTAYYTENLHLNIVRGAVVHKPYYDVGCKFLAQLLSTVTSNCDDFLKSKGLTRYAFPQ